MGDYFKPLHRKFGLVMLACACLCLSWWMRASMNSTDLSRSEAWYRAVTVAGKEIALPFCMQFTVAAVILMVIAPKEPKDPDPPVQACPTITAHCQFPDSHCLSPHGIKKLAGIMSEFFKPLRRKIGVVTFTMTITLIRFWYRSVGEGDVMRWPEFSEGTTINTFVSSDSVLKWQRRYGLAPYFSSREFSWFPKWYPLYVTHVDQRGREMTRATIPELELHQTVQWQLWGLGVSHRTISEGIGITLYYIPYWWMVVPLTLLSAYLLLSRPRAPKPVPPVAENA